MIVFFVLWGVLQTGWASWYLVQCIIWTRSLIQAWRGVQTSDGHIRSSYSFLSFGDSSSRVFREKKAVDVQLLFIFPENVTKSQTNLVGWSQILKLADEIKRLSIRHYFYGIVVMVFFGSVLQTVVLYMDKTGSLFNMGLTWTTALHRHITSIVILWV